MALNLGRKNIIVEEKKIEQSKRNFFVTKMRDKATESLERVSKVNLMKSTEMIRERGKKLAMRGLKGGLVGAGAMAANGVVAGATGNALGALATTGLGGIVVGTSAGAAIVTAVPVVAGFGAACLVGSAISELVQKE